LSKVCITGGAGFIGLALTRELLDNGYEVKIIDNLSPQIHSHNPLDHKTFDGVDFIKGDIRDEYLLKEAISDVDHFVHLAAETGTGQSMYMAEHYSDVNVMATSKIFDLIVNKKIKNKLKSIVVASSRSIYGEGAYLCKKHGRVFPKSRDHEFLDKGFFEPLCPICSSDIYPTATREDDLVNPISIYAMTKFFQEKSLLACAKILGINGIALRYQNVYGPGQSLNNPYTGILSIFANLAKDNKPIEIYEDGIESRDFVYIDDVVCATKNAMFLKKKYTGAINIGSGVSVSVIEVAKNIRNHFNSDAEFIQVGTYREGDIRHNYADLNIASSVLNFSPGVDFKTGIKEFLNWSASNSGRSGELYLASRDELSNLGLINRK